MGCDPAVLGSVKGAAMADKIPWYKWPIYFVWAIYKLLTEKKQ